MTRLSGAELLVVKRASTVDDINRLLAQYRWLQERHDRDGLVNVGHWVGNGYEMELLDRDRHIPVHNIVAVIVSLLQWHVWEVKTGERPTWDVHLAYVKERGGAPWLLEWGEQLRDVATSCPLIETHGDPTPDNFLQRTQVWPVLIDPLPDLSDGRIPTLREADLGKLLGWGIPNPEWEEEVLLWTTEPELVRYFAAVAVTRRAYRSGEDLSWLSTWTGFSSKAGQR